jgi:hypothetical protein
MRNFEATVLLSTIDLSQTLNTVIQELPKENKLKPGALSLKQPQQVRQQKNVSTPSRAAVAPPQRAGSNVSMNSTGAVSSYKKPASTAPPKKPSMPTTNSAGRVSQFSLTQQMPRPAQQKQASPSADSNVCNYSERHKQLLYIFLFRKLSKNC